MIGARRLLNRLLSDTEEEIKNVKNLKLPENLQLSPYKAIRYFYPSIGFKDSELTVYASRAAGRGRPSLLQELLLGIPVMIDITDGKTFSDEYGMEPDEIATQVKYDRLIPVTNASNPLDWSDDFIKYIKPILKTKKLQFAHHRTTAFQSWLISGASDRVESNKLEKVGKEIFSEFFTPSNEDEWSNLIAALRVDRYKNPKEVAVRAVAGRYRNICALRPSFQSQLPNTFKELRSQGYTAAQLAALLNGIKNIVSGPITAGRGGILERAKNNIEK